ncbi:MAG: hypothetical protein CMH83_19530 [Nocardioides sp.]|nr:hypothetical protein [Nocardioides sp.]
MARTDLWNRASDLMADDSDPRWQAVSMWLRNEAVVRLEMEPFIELINAAIERKGGPTAYLRLRRNNEGDPVMDCDTSEGATSVALAYLDHHAKASDQEDR